MTKVDAARGGSASIGRPYMIMQQARDQVDMHMADLVPLGGAFQQSSSPGLSSSVAAAAARGGTYHWDRRGNTS